MKKTTPPIFWDYAINIALLAIMTFGISVLFYFFSECFLSDIKRTVILLLYFAIWLMFFAFLAIDLLIKIRRAKRSSYKTFHNKPTKQQANK